MAATDTALFALNRRVSTHFFTLLGGKAKKIASEESLKMANSMEYILRHRQYFKDVGGQFPRWDPSPKSKPISKKSFNNWSVRPWGENAYALRYTDPASEESYVKLLTNGLIGDTNHVWYKSFHGILKTARTKPFTSKLVMKNGRIFSSQMPEGLNPWLKVKRTELNKNIVRRMREEL